MKYLIIFLILVNLSVFSRSDSTKTHDYIIFPFGFYTTDTSVALGTFFNYNCNDEDKIFSNLIYTFKDQKIFFVITENKFKDVYFENKFWLEDYYLEYYGVGNNTKLGNEFKYGYFYLENFFSTGFMPYKKWKVLFSLSNFYYSPGYSSKDILELDRTDVFSNGIGFILRYDRVNNEFFRTGKMFESNFIVYPEFFGSDQTFYILENQMNYHRAIGPSAFNLQFLTRNIFGDPHFHKLSSLGGSSVLRGYPERRFVDRNMAAFQFEFDYEIYKALNGAVFASVGDVYDDIDDLSLKNIKTGFGAGFIYHIKDLGIRVEAASSPEGNLQIIITGAKAF